MTHTELGEYVKDIQSEIEETYHSVSCTVKEKTSKYGDGWTITIHNIIESNKSNRVMDLIISKMNILFDLDLELHLISGLMGDQSHVYTDWKHMKADLRDYRGWQSIEITIGKLSRKIKKFAAF